MDASVDAPAVSGGVSLPSVGANLSAPSASLDVPGEPGRWTSIMSFGLFVLGRFEISRRFHKLDNAVCVLYAIWCCCPLDTLKSDAEERHSTFVPINAFCQYCPFCAP